MRTVDGMGHDDLYQEGCIALCRAAVSYREEMGSISRLRQNSLSRNYLLDRCRESNLREKSAVRREMGAPGRSTLFTQKI